MKRASEGIPSNSIAIHRTTFNKRQLESYFIQYHFPLPYRFCWHEGNNSIVILCGNRRVSSL